MFKGVVCCALAAVWSDCDSARAEDFPSRYVTIGGSAGHRRPTDTVARIVAEGMRAPLGQTVVVENTPGAGGATGVIRVARSAPDGYTMQIGQWGTNVAAGVVHNLPIDLLKDLEPVGLIATQPSLIVGRKDLPPNDLKELVAWLKANPGKVSVGTSRNWQSKSRVRCVLPEHHPGQVRVHSLSQRRQVAEGPDRRPSRHDHRHAGDLGPERQERADQGLSCWPARTVRRCCRTFRPWTRPGSRACTSISGTRCGCRRARPSR